MLKVIHADDQALMRYAVTQFMLHHSDMTMVGQASSGSELLEILPMSDADLILTDWNMPGLGGEELIGDIRSAFPSLPILVHSADDDTCTQHRALEAGATSFISKNCSPNLLLKAMLDTTLSGVK